MELRERGRERGRQSKEASHRHRLVSDSSTEPGTLRRHGKDAVRWGMHAVRWLQREATGPTNVVFLLKEVVR